MAGVPIGLYDAGLLFSLYSVVGYTDRRFALVALSVATVAVLVGAATDWWGYVDRQLAAPSTSVRLLSSFGAAGLVAITWALGERLRSGRAGVIALSARADQLERDREQQAIIAAAGERARIAREMHDVIAHGLSVMVVQADGAAYVVEQSPATGRAVLEQIAATGRESLAQMRDLLGLLRADGDDLTLASAEHDDGGPTHVPQPALDDIPELVAEASAAGADVTLTDTGDSGAVPPMVQLTAYRVVQEALTNARKHGGRAVEVTMDHSTSGLRVIIRNGPPDLGGPAVTGPPGHGLVGMAERVAAVGGDLHTRAVQDGGFVVDAWLPFRGEGPLHE
nr:histidine kinase [Microlunatus panaciterrae]